MGDDPLVRVMSLTGMSVGRGDGGRDDSHYLYNVNKQRRRYPLTMSVTVSWGVGCGQGRTNWS